MNTTNTPTKPNRLQKIEALLALRKNWTIQDFEDAYSDDWYWKPNQPQDDLRVASIYDRYNYILTMRH